MVNNNILKDLLAFRENLNNDLLKGKISKINYAYRTYFYFKQNRFKFIKKAHDLNSIVFNYFFWLSRIERRVMIERELYEINPEIASSEKLEEINFFFVRRRNQMLRRILVEFEKEIKIEQKVIVYQDVVEALISFGEYSLPFYANKEVFDRLKLEVQPLSKGVNTHYLPYIFYDLPLEINK